MAGVYEAIETMTLDQVQGVPEKGKLKLQMATEAQKASRRTRALKSAAPYKPHGYEC